MRVIAEEPVTKFDRRVRSIVEHVTPALRVSLEETRRTLEEVFALVIVCDDQEQIVTTVIGLEKKQELMDELRERFKSEGAFAGEIVAYVEHVDREPAKGLLRTLIVWAEPNLARFVKVGVQLFDGGSS